MKILNLYAGIGGNRKLWGNEHEITAVELNEKVACIYRDLYPNDTVVVGDAHEYLLKHYKEFDFIWASPPCTTHSRLNFMKAVKEYPDMKLYQEIIFLKTFFKGDFIVENVIPYYKPLIEPTFILSRHCYWSSKDIDISDYVNSVTFSKIADKVELLEAAYGFDLSKFRGKANIRTCLRNVVTPTDGKYILEKMYETQNKDTNI